MENIGITHFGITHFGDTEEMYITTIRDLLHHNLIRDTLEDNLHLKGL
jgi:hypothetical protein